MCFDGNPHAVLFVDHVNEIALEEIGPVIEHAESFPERVSLGIAHVLNGHKLIIEYGKEVLVLRWPAVQVHVPQ